MGQIRKKWQNGRLKSKHTDACTKNLKTKHFAQKAEIVGFGRVNNEISATCHSLGAFFTCRQVKATLRKSVYRAETSTGAVAIGKLHVNRQHSRNKGYFIIAKS